MNIFKTLITLFQSNMDSIETIEHQKARIEDLEYQLSLSKFRIKVQTVNKIGDVIKNLDTLTINAHTHAKAESLLLLDINIRKRLVLTQVQNLTISHRDSRNYDGTLITARHLWDSASTEYQEPSTECWVPRARLEVLTGMCYPPKTLGFSLKAAEPVDNFV